MAGTDPLSTKHSQAEIFSAWLRLSINPEIRENGKEGCARLPRRACRSQPPQSGGT